MQRPPTLSQVLRGDQTGSIHCLLNTALSDWACNKLGYNFRDVSLIIFSLMLFDAVGNQSACVIIEHDCFIPTAVSRTQEHGGLEDPAIARAKLFVVLMRLENKSFL